MKNLVVFAALILGLVISQSTLTAQEKAKQEDNEVQKEQARLKKVTEKQMQEARRLHRKSRNLSEELSEERLHELESKLHELQEGKLEEVQEKLRDIDFHELRHIAEIELPEIPEINIVIPEIEFDLENIEFDFEFDHDLEFNFDTIYEEDHVIRIDGDKSHFIYSSGARKLFSDLSDDEEIKIQAIRALDKNNATATLPVLQKLFDREASPAIRYAATRKLHYFLKNEKSIDLLGDRARNDPNIQVRKAAISILGKSDKKKAKAILEELAKE
ncbi:MAG: hypothetical protein DWQ05_22680 [Calditrichaeota bacterium]|nr:MAG: hypothetical protein DWQ05_22680 [Calditrichota bacterium]